LPIPFNYTLKKVLRRVDLSQFLKINNSSWVVWGYAGIVKNIRAATVPLISVVFRDIVNGNLSDEETQRYIPVSLLGQVRLGSIWNNGRCNTEINFDNHENFIVDFTIGSWQFNSFMESLLSSQQPPYPRDIHSFQFHSDKSYFIEFPISTGGKLVIPCMEFFTSCYGYSDEVNRVLATYPRDQILTRLSAPIDTPDNGNWVVNLPPSLSNHDATFVAHLKYDNYTQIAARLIYAQIEAALTKSTDEAFIKIYPWFKGLAELKVEGLWFDNHKSFLAFKINGVSDPNGVPIERYRQYKKKIEHPTSGNEEDPPKNIPERNLVFPKIVNISKDSEPNRNSSTTIIFNESRKKLGVPRVVISGKLTKSGSGSKLIIKDPNSPDSEFSTGEEHGSGEGTGRAIIYTKVTLESNGVLQDMWRAMLYLQRKFPSSISSVNWYSFADGFSDNVEPKQIELPAFDDDSLSIATKKNLKWILLDRKNLRSILATRLIINNKAVYFIEIQRRIVDKKTEYGGKVSKEENFQGIVFTLTNDDNYEVTLHDFLYHVRFFNGVVYRFVPYIIGQAATFNHVHTDEDQVSLESSVLNALGKMQISLNKN